MRAKKLTGLVSIVIVTSLVLVIAIPMKLPEIVYLLAYAQDGRDSYSDGYDRDYEDGQDHPINEQIRDGESGHNE